MMPYDIVHILVDCFASICRTFNNNFRKVRPVFVSPIRIMLGPSALNRKRKFVRNIGENIIELRI